MRRIAALVCVAAAGVFAWLAIAPVFASAGADTPSLASQLTAYSSIADAAGVFFTADSNTGIETTYQTIYGRLPDSFGRYSTQSILGRASVYYPGAAVVGIGTLLCQLPVPCLNLPKYPLSVQASESVPDATVNSPAPEGGAGAPVGLGVANADAHADQDKGVHTNAVIAGLDSPQGVGTVLHVGSIQTHTSEDVEPAPKTLQPLLVDHAETSLKGIDILQGLIHIDTIFTTSTSTDDGQGHHTKTEDYQVSGVTVNGNQATIGANGVTVNGASTGNPVASALNGVLQAVLANTGLTIHVIGHSKANYMDSQCTGGEVDGVEIRGQEKVTFPSGLPPAVAQLSDTYFVDIILGGACTDAFAEATSGPPPSGTGSGSASGGATTGVGSSVSGTSSGPILSGGSTPGGSVTSGGSPATGSVGAAPQQLASGPTAPLQRAGLTEGFGRGVHGRIELLYLVMSILFVALVLGLRPFTPSRLPSGR